MQYAKLGRSGLDVSPICIGGMGFGDPLRGHPAWSLGEEASRALIRHALEAGINFFDTANLYSNGHSEEILGRALKDLTVRDSVVIATKVSAPTRNGPNTLGLSRKAILAEIDHSLRRLGTDYIDLYQIHRQRPAHPVGRNAGDPARSGKAGKGALPGRVLDDGVGVQQGASPAEGERLDTFRVDVGQLQPPRPRGGARDVAALCRRGCADDGLQPLSRGRLARSWNETTARSNAEPEGARQNEATAASDRAIVEAVAAARGVTSAQIALAWLRRNAVIAAPIVGALTAKHIDDAVAALAITLTNEEALKLEVGLIRFRGHLPRGGYDVPHAQSEAGPPSAPAVH